MLLSAFIANSIISFLNVHPATQLYDVRIVRLFCFLSNLEVTAFLTLLLAFRTFYVFVLSCVEHWRCNFVLRLCFNRTLSIFHFLNNNGQSVSTTRTRF